MNTCPLTWTILDSRVSCIKPWVLTAQRREYNLYWIPQWVHWIRKSLTAQHERLIPIIWSNICDCNIGSWRKPVTATVIIWRQSKVEEAEFNDVPAGNCDIPDTSAVLREVIWKIWTWKESTKTIQIFAGDTSCEQKTYYQLTFKRIYLKKASYITSDQKPWSRFTLFGDPIWGDSQSLCSHRTVQYFCSVHMELTKQIEYFNHAFA